MLHTSKPQHWNPSSDFEPSSSCLVFFLPLRLARILATPVIASSRPRVAFQPPARVRHRRAARRRLVRVQSTAIPGSCGDYNSHHAPQPAPSPPLCPPSLPWPAVGKLSAFICRPGGRDTDPCDLPRPERCAGGGGGGGGGSQPSSAFASAPARSLRGPTVSPGAARGWSSACSSPPPRASWRWARRGPAAGRVCVVGAAGRRSCGRRAALAPVRLGALRVRRLEPAPGRWSIILGQWIGRGAKVGGGPRTHPRAHPARPERETGKWSRREAPSSSWVARGFGDGWSESFGGPASLGVSSCRFGTLSPVLCCTGACQAAWFANLAPEWNKFKWNLLSTLCAPPPSMFLQFYTCAERTVNQVCPVVPGVFVLPFFFFWPRVL